MGEGVEGRWTWRGQHQRRGRRSSPPTPTLHAKPRHQLCFRHGHVCLILQPQRPQAPEGVARRADKRRNRASAGVGHAGGGGGDVQWVWGDASMQDGRGGGGGWRGQGGHWGQAGGCRVQRELAPARPAPQPTPRLAGAGRLPTATLTPASRPSLGLAPRPCRPRSHGCPERPPPHSGPRCVLHSNRSLSRATEPHPRPPPARARLTGSSSASRGGWRSGPPGPTPGI